jgi:hypothetical protein
MTNTTNQHEKASVPPEPDAKPLSLAYLRKDWAEDYKQLDAARAEHDLFVEGVIEHIIERLEYIEQVIEPIRQEQRTRAMADSYWRQHGGGDD